MTKTLYISIFLFLQFQFTNAQLLDSVSVTDPIGDQLAIIAWQNNSSNLAFESNKGVVEQRLKVSKFRFFEGLGFRFNLNEFTINPNPEINNFYPRYNFGYSFGLGQVMDIAQATKLAKSQLVELQLKLRQDSLVLRSNVLQQYENYKMRKELMLMAREKVININSELKIVEQEYSDGAADISEYNRVLELYTSARSNEITATNEFVISQIKLEELLGMSLQDVMKEFGN